MAASSHALYQAWTRGFERWFAHPGTTTMRAEVGAPFFFETRYDGGRHPHYGRFLTLDPDRKVELTWVTGAAGTEGAETVVGVDLTPSGGRTRLQLSHAGFPNEAAMLRHRDAWAQVLEHLDEVTATDGD
jgi:uncharacterized protein YndB with AHSA1/START domain